jgi:mannose-6-phosphate isomerase-like protein (cupin superfamily)
LSECREFLGGDHTILRELLHPARAQAEVRYSLAHGRLEAGTRSKLHRLASSEVYYVLAGRGTFRVENETQPVEAGDVVYVPPRASQSLENHGTETIEFLCLVDPAWRPEDEEVLE